MQHSINMHTSFLCFLFYDFSLKLFFFFIRYIYASFTSLQLTIYTHTHKLYGVLYMYIVFIMFSFTATKYVNFLFGLCLLFNIQLVFTCAPV